MMDKGWNKYWFRSLPRHERARIIMADARNELAIVQEITKIALETDGLEKPKEFDDEDSEFQF